MKLLGVDLGQRRVGFAVCDTELPLALAHKVTQVAGRDDIVAAIIAEKNELGAERIVIGLPLEMNGRSGEKAREAESYKDFFCEQGIDAVLFDERLTSATAHAMLKSANLNRKDRMKSVDAISAQLILQSYVDVNL